VLPPVHIGSFALGALVAEPTQGEKSMREDDADAALKENSSCPPSSSLLRTVVEGGKAFSADSRVEIPEGEAERVEIPEGGAVNVEIQEGDAARVEIPEGEAARVEIPEGGGAARRARRVSASADACWCAS